MSLHGFILRSSSQQFHPKILDSRPYIHSLSQLTGYDAHLFIKELEKKFKKDGVRVIVESKEKYFSYNVKNNAKLVGVTNRDGKEVLTNIQVRFMNSCRIMALSLDKRANTLFDTSGIQCDKFKGDMELINICNNYITLLECKKCQTKKTKDLDVRALK